MKVGMKNICRYEYDFMISKCVICPHAGQFALLWFPIFLLAESIPNMPMKNIGVFTLSKYKNIIIDNEL